MTEAVEVQSELFPTASRLIRCDPARNMRRFYRLVLQPDLFGGCTLVREWGRIGAGGTIRLDHHADEGRATDALAAMHRRKTKRGYRDAFE